MSADEGARQSGPAAAVGQARAARPAQTVLVLQGGGALGAYHLGVYQAMHEAGIEPDWVVGTSIGAVNACLIAGNRPQERLRHLEDFWNRVTAVFPPPHVPDWFSAPWLGLGRSGGSQGIANLATITGGVPAFFAPNPYALRGIGASVGVQEASYYSTAPLRATLQELSHVETINSGPVRITVGAVNVQTGELRYFDSRREAISIEHIMASGALPPGFGAIPIDEMPYWDGGVYSNSPIEVVFDDEPRRDSLIFAVNVWHRAGPAPESIWQVLGREKDIQYASRTASHVERQQQIHRLRHVIRELCTWIPEAQRADERVAQLAAWGCSTTMHIAHLIAPRLPGEDWTKDIDFTESGIEARRQAGYADARRIIERAPWGDPVDPLQGVVEHC